MEEGGKFILSVPLSWINIYLFLKKHNGSPPYTYAEKKEFKNIIRNMKKQSDEENFEEAEAQAYRCWTPTGIPSEVAEVFNDQSVVKLQPSSPPFCHLAAALHSFTEDQPPYTLPLSSTLPDMKSSTAFYIELQKLYKKRAEEEKEILKSYIRVPGIKDDFIDLFVKNSHGIRMLRGEQWGKLDADPQALGTSLIFNFLEFHFCFLTTNDDADVVVLSDRNRNLTKTSSNPSCLECLRLAVKEKSTKPSTCINSRITYG